MQGVSKTLWVSGVLVMALFGQNVLAQPAGKGTLKGGSEYEKRLEGAGMSGMSGMSGDHSSTASVAKGAKKQAAKGTKTAKTKTAKKQAM